MAFQRSKVLSVLSICPKENLSIVFEIKANFWASVYLVDEYGGHLAICEGLPYINFKDLVHLNIFDERVLIF